VHKTITSHSHQGQWSSAWVNTVTKAQDEVFKVVPVDTSLLMASPTTAQETRLMHLQIARRLQLRSTRPRYGSATRQSAE
jgi:hypothetical protein